MQATEKGRAKADAAAAEFGIKSLPDQIRQFRRAEWRGNSNGPLSRSCGVTLTDEERSAVMYVFGCVSKGMRALAINRDITLADVVTTFRAAKN